MAFPDPNSPLPPLPPPNPPLLLRISHLSLSFFVAVSESRRGVKVQQQLPMSRCLRASLLAIAPSLRTYMKNTLLLWSDGMDFGVGGVGGEVVFRRPNRNPAAPVVPVTHELRLYWNHNRKSLQLSCEKQPVEFSFLS